MITSYKRIAAGVLPFLKDLPFSTFGRLCASEQGTSIHAATAVATHDRKKLEKLLRYLARPALANSRLSFCTDKQHVLLEFKKPFRDGSTHLKLTPLELIERLAALVPPPRAHLVHPKISVSPGVN